LRGARSRCGSFCRDNPARISASGQFVPGSFVLRKTTPDTIFRTLAKSMVSQNLNASGTALAKSHAGKMPKEHCSKPERRDHYVL
jgi:hypothetical protein